MHRRLVLGGVLARRPQNRAALEMDAGNVIDREMERMIHVSPRQPFESVEYPDHFLAARSHTLAPPAGQSAPKLRR